MKHSIPTWKLSEILNSHFCTGVDGADYGPVKHELEIELWKRGNKETEELIKRLERDFKDYFKWQASKHKRKAV